jgi:hypothetical protein
MNKKGSLPIILLVLGVFAVGSLALLSFIVADFKTTNSFVGVGVMKSLNEDLDEYAFYNAQGVLQEDLMKWYNLTEEGNSLCFYVEDKTQRAFKLTGEGDKILFSVKYCVPKKGL